MFAIIPDSLVRVSRRVRGSTLKLRHTSMVTLASRKVNRPYLSLGPSNFTLYFTLIRKVLFTFPSQYFYAIGLAYCT